MARAITSAAAYKSAKISHKDPIKLLHFLYEMHCDPKFKLSPNQFQLYLAIWIRKKSKLGILAGSLRIIKYFDSKFAQ